MRRFFPACLDAAETGVIDLTTGWIDLESGDYARLLRSPDLRLVGLSWDCQTFAKPFFLDFPDPTRACLYYVLEGAAYFRTGPGDDELHYVAAGTTVGVEGHAHQWMDASHVHMSHVRKLAKGTLAEDLPVRLVLSSIDRSAAVLQRLPHGAIVIPADADPYAGIIKGCVELAELDRSGSQGDEGVRRRLAEVIMLQIIGYARSRLWAGAAPANGVLHDEFLLRAMTAFFADPAANWTVASLAQAAGLSRAAFSERFSKAFGEPPLRTVNRLRLHQGAEMLCRSNASLHDIAIEIGFGSSAAFLRAFKRQFEMTPGGWREQHRPA
jgi:AraC-like DNA-binding protein